MVLTRLHTRYTKENLGDDLVFRKADPIAGGRELRVPGTGSAGVNGQKGHGLEKGASPSSYNNFQGRYIIRIPWDGEVACENPRYGIWVGPPGDRGPETATETAFAPRGKIELAELLSQDIPELGIEASPPGEK